MPKRPAFSRWLNDTNDVTQTFLAAGQVPDLINLAGGLPDPSTWPVGELADLAQKAVADYSSQTLAYPPIDGLPELRDVLAERFSTDGLVLTRDNVLVTTGGTQALDLIGKVLLDDGGLVAAQSPTYLGALDAWRPRRPVFRPMRLGANDFAPVPMLSGAQFAYTVPNFSNPSGRLVDLDQRQALADAAETTGTWLVEDDPYGTLYYDGPPLPRMINLTQSADSSSYDGPVIYLGTLSKELAPGLRIGWVIAAPKMIKALTTAKQGTDMCSSGVTQRIALDAMASGLTDRILPDILSLYRNRRDAICAAMDEHLSGLFDWDRPTGGMFVWATAREPGFNTDRLMQIGLERGVCVSPSSVFDPLGKDCRSIRINFTLNPPDKLTEGIERLARASKALLAETTNTFV